MDNKKTFNIFFRDKPALMLLDIKNSKEEVYASMLAKRTDCTYAHVIKILQEIEKAGLINVEKHGRLKLITLTKKGAETSEHIEAIKSLL